MSNERRPPRWVTAFLRALERTGQARTAAQDAGVDHTTAYARRRAHADFAEAWAEALRAHAAGKKRCQQEGIDALAQDPSTIASSGNGSPPRAELREELMVSGDRLKRASCERWGRGKQEVFLAELAMTGILRRACDAVRISRQAIDRRRRNNPHFDAACKAAIAACRARIPEFLAGAAAATFDPDALPDDGINPLPKISVAEAIKIAQLDFAKANTGEQRRMSDEQAAGDIEALREELFRRFMKLRERNMREQLEQGWSYDEERDRTVPPGWVRSPDHCSDDWEDESSQSPG